MDKSEIDLSAVRPEIGSYGEVRPFKDVQSFLLAGKGIIMGDGMARSVELKKRFLEMLEYPEFHLMSGVEQAAAIGVSPSTIPKWFMQCPDEVLAEALKKQRERHARASFRVDSALMKECQAGNVKAMDLYYRRIEGWVPKQDMELTRGRDKELDSKANVQLLKELFAGLSKEEKLEVLGEGGIPPVEGNVWGLEGGVEEGDDVRMG